MTGGVGFFRRRGDAPSRPPVAYKTGHSPINVSVLALNGDRHQDLLVVNGVRDDISVFFGKGDGTFTQGISFGANAGPIATVTLPLDGHVTTDTAIAINLSS